MRREVLSALLQEEPWGERNRELGAPCTPCHVLGVSSLAPRHNSEGFQGKSSPGGAGLETGEGTHKLQTGFVFQGKTLGLR